MKRNKIFFIISTIFLVITSWVNIETFFSSYEWWYWWEDQGEKWMLFLYIGLPCVIISIIFRFISMENKIYNWIDLIIWVIYFIELFLPIKILKIVLFNDIMYAIYSIVMVLLPIIILVIYLINIKKLDSAHNIG